MILMIIVEMFHLFQVKVFERYFMQDKPRCIRMQRKFGQGRKRH